ncbi:aminotransferase class III-fold pyridoxal phosphate-dependent enzyme [Leptospira kirschneri]|uniref:aminotransferase class III-fold pyridoxal phosphate-dependent enzyme n=1 Tax=Leptospira kirschneri TaxID=29507 RepID=UPI002260B70A|nr:aminotransferase class III-fold pyridoxal phosphate-dependent enzyme [Leptospira kirschneri]UZW34818.1 aminotransferase class III-fold pyridoxal phosphate-dependent enzyme [Leptospira kirschneri]WHO98524.1 aminotransferase class III-fold pyridoxal phosphate-dependent enzyme [Leptospira kirschneri]
MKILAIVQARTRSTRFPNKVLQKIKGKSLIELLFSRLARSKMLNEVILATSNLANDNLLVDVVKNLGFGVYRGSENDVLSRYYTAAKYKKADVVVRITGDCPLIDSNLVDQVINKFFRDQVDYCSNVDPPMYPDGLDIEVFNFQALEKSYHLAQKENYREHVTPFIRKSNEFKKSSLGYHTDLSSLRWTVDELVDLEVVKKVFEHFHPNIYFSWLDVLDLYNKYSEIFSINRHLIRNEGMNINTGPKLWKRAKTLIPGGNMLLSKRSEMFLPNRWPAYYSKTEGCKIWDLDGKEYIDTFLMGVGTNILGYSHLEIDNAVRSVIDTGNMSTFNAPEEIYLAEKLIQLHPWANMVRFARSESEANAIAIQVSRAASGKDKVAICRYHDCYLSANLYEDDNLFTELESNRVSKNLSKTVFSFQYNRFDELKKLIQQNEIGVIKMEISRNPDPENNFLHKVRKLATDKKIVLIFDECISGFRQTYGGLHKFYGVEPDMAVFGKALGNGYAITAIIGKREIMEAAQTTFIGSTSWTERIGVVAGLKTLEVMERERSWEKITAIGNHVKDRWKKLALKYSIDIDVWDLPALASFTFRSKNAIAYKTLVTQEMLKNRFLAGNSFYACTEHTLEIIDQYFEFLDPIFSLIRECEDSKDVSLFLKDSICHTSFKKLNMQ